jgi:pimeloyl-ACP methyl ester carboxylesterase
VLCIHGLAASLHDWDELLPALAAAGYGAYALDLLGHGGSLKPASLRDYSATAAYRHTAAWIDSLQLEEPAVLIGHSLGGNLAVEYTLQYPERVRALVLVNPFYSIRQLPVLLRTGYGEPWVTAELIDLTPAWLVRSIIDITSRSISNGFVEPEASRAQSALDYKRAAPGIFNMPHTIRELSQDLPAVHAPTLVVWGARDQTLAPASFQKMVAILPNARGAAIQAGHVPHRSHAPAFNQLVLDFLRSL